MLNALKEGYKTMDKEFSLIFVWLLKLKLLGGVDLFLREKCLRKSKDKEMRQEIIY